MDIFQREIGFYVEGVYLSDFTVFYVNTVRPLISSSSFQNFQNLMRSLVSNINYFYEKSGETKLKDMLLY